MTRAFSRKCRLVMLGVALCVLLASCSTWPEAPPPHDRAPAAKVKDRDERAVVDALVRLDMCALLATVVADEASRYAVSPSMCGSADLSAAVVVLGWDRRVELPSRIVNGAKAYLDDGGQGSCTLWLPVSFRLAIRFEGQKTCDAVATQVAPAVAVLAEPTSVETAPSWDACAALATVPGVDVGRVDDPAVCFGDKNRVSLEFRYTELAGYPSSGWRKQVVHGVDVWTNGQVDPNGKGCVAEWDLGPAATSDARDPLVAHVGADDCEQVSHAVDTLVDTLRTTPEAGRPQRPLLYRPDEPDSPYPGGCAFLKNPTECAPYAKKPLPPRGELASATDPNVYCTVATDAVTEAFGSEMVPVTTPDTCYFVSPARLVEVTFTLSPEPLGKPEKGERVTISGHPGIVTSDKSRHTVGLAATTSADQPGTLSLHLSSGPVAEREPLPAEVVDKAEPVLAAIVRRYFSG